MVEKQVIPAIKEMYDNHGNPVSDRTDNDPPFNSEQFKSFSVSRGIQHHKAESQPCGSLYEAAGKRKATHQ